MLFHLSILLGFSALLLTADAYQSEVLVVVGAEGAQEYGQVFAENAALWQAAATQGEAKLTTIDADGESALDTIKTYLSEIDKEQPLPLWIILIGHGTYDKRQAYFNLAGADLSAAQLKEWIEPIKRPLILINTASCSGAFLPILSGPSRIIMTATKSGTEVNYASFGVHLAAALLEPEADLNNDGENSVYECYHYAAKQTANFYEQEGRIATETPLLDDNGDGRGTSLESIAAMESGGKADRQPDGSFAKRWSLILSAAEQAIPPEIRQQRNVLESQVEELRRGKDELADAEYYQELEKLLLQIAELYQSLPAAE